MMNMLSEVGKLGPFLATNTGHPLLRFVTVHWRTGSIINPLGPDA